MRDHRKETSAPIGLATLHFCNGIGLRSHRVDSLGRCTKNQCQARSNPFENDVVLALPIYLLALRHILRGSGGQMCPPAGGQGSRRTPGKEQLYDGAIPK
jgi:hypothetical protein